MAKRDNDSVEASHSIVERFTKNDLPRVELAAREWLVCSELEPNEKDIVGVQLIKFSEEELQDLNRELSDSVSNGGTFPWIVQVGDMVAKPLDGSYYRGWVCRIDGDTAWIYEIDFGILSEINIHELRPLNRKFMTQLPMGLRCRVMTTLQQSVLALQQPFVAINFEKFIDEYGIDVYEFALESEQETIPEHLCCVEESAAEVPVPTLGNGEAVEIVNELLTPIKAQADADKLIVSIASPMLDSVNSHYNQNGDEVDLRQLGQQPFEVCALLNEVANGSWQEAIIVALHNTDAEGGIRKQATVTLPFYTGIIETMLAELCRPEACRPNLPLVPVPNSMDITWRYRVGIITLDGEATSGYMRFYVGKSASPTELDVLLVDCGKRVQIEASSTYICPGPIGALPIASAEVSLHGGVGCLNENDLQVGDCVLLRVLGTADDEGVIPVVVRVD